MYGPGLTKLTQGKDRGTAATLQVDVIADLICPWCYLGKRHLDDALNAVHGPSLVSWYPFQLNPAMPESGMAFEQYLDSKFGEARDLAPALDELTATGKAAGIDFQFDKIERVPNTLDAHRVMKLAETGGLDASALAENILSGFFERGLDISDRDVLCGLAGQHGISARDVHSTLESDQSRDMVLAQEAQLRQNGVNGVPDFLVNKRLFVVGAQTTESLVSVFDRVMFGEESDLPVSPTVH